MTYGLVDVGYSLPKGQTVKLIFFAPCLCKEGHGFHSTHLGLKNVHLLTDFDTIYLFLPHVCVA